MPLCSLIWCKPSGYVYISGNRFEKSSALLYIVYGSWGSRQRAYLSLSSFGIASFPILQQNIWILAKKATKTNLNPEIPVEKESTPDQIHWIISIPPILERKGWIIKFSASLQTYLKFLHIYIILSWVFSAQEIEETVKF